MATYHDLPPHARQRLAVAERVAVLTGAGISAESGVPTFRGPQGLWRSFRPEELATPEAFARDPQMVWEWYDWRRGKVAACRPNAGHTALAAMGVKVPSFTLITQNVDGLHRLAGSTDPVELHGNIWQTRCLGCGKVQENRQTPLVPLPPTCPTCGGMLRPHIVWFGESLDPAILGRAQQVAGDADVFMVVGTSSVVWPAAGLAEVAAMNGATIIEINVEETPLTPDADVTLLGPAGYHLPRIVEGLWG
ncbi:MAG: NAD-dependent deacylase [Nitrospinae bacterium]|nr:NAD-dependent deacylase [Nitrospinota bacterium]